MKSNWVLLAIGLYVIYKMTQSTQGIYPPLPTGQPNPPEWLGLPTVDWLGNL